MFTFRTVTTDLSTTSAQLGTVIMACNYNAGAPQFESKQQMLQYDGAGDVKISHDLMFGIECDAKKNGLGPVLFVALNGSVPIGEDPKTYFLGQFQIATNQCITTGQIGELWVSYKVVLRKPKFSVGLGQAIPCSYFNGTITTLANNTAGSIVQGVVKATKQYNNIEDVQYGGGTPTSIYPYNLVATGTINMLPSAAFPTYASLGNDCKAGWYVNVTSTVATVFYVFPPWLQQGTYQFDLGVFTTISEVSGPTLPTPATGQAQLLELINDNSSNSTFSGAVIRVLTSYQSQNVANPSGGSFTPILPILRWTWTGTFTTATPLQFSVAQVNPLGSASGALVF